jgi:hypothetical protein
VFDLALRVALEGDHVWNVGGGKFCGGDGKQLDLVAVVAKLNEEVGAAVEIVAAVWIVAPVRIAAVRIIAAAGIVSFFADRNDEALFGALTVNREPGTVSR